MWLLLVFSPAEIELYIFQIYFCTLNLKYNSHILLEIFWFPKFVTLKNNINLYVSSILCIHQVFSDELYFKYTLNLFLKCICISFLSQKYTWRDFQNMYLLSNLLNPFMTRRPLSYRNQSIDFLCKSMDWFLYDNGFRHEMVKSILEVDFLNLKIYIQSLKYTFWIDTFFSNSEIYLMWTF